jgi:hypothetical protein
MKKLNILIACLLLATFANAQKTEDSVKAAVNKLFIAMAMADSVGIMHSFTESGLLQSVSEKDGKTTVETDKVTEFAHIIGGLQKNDADEQIKFNTIKIDGPLAFVWAPYNFFYKGKFSHCGVDCFQVVRMNGEWKIQYIIDTRRKDGCKY